MSKAAASLHCTDEASALSSQELVALVRAQATTIGTLTEQLKALQHQLEWFKRQVFGAKSERFVAEPSPAQLPLGVAPTLPAEAAVARKAIPAHTRRTPKRHPQSDADALPFFDAARVPVQTITLTDPAVADLPADQVELIGEKITYRLAQRLRQLRGAQVRAPDCQAPRHPDPALSAGACGRPRGQPRTCQLHRRAAHRQVCLPPAPVSPAPALGACRDHGELRRG